MGAGFAQSRMRCCCLILYPKKGRDNNDVDLYAVNIILVTMRRAQNQNRCKIPLLLFFIQHAKVVSVLNTSRVPHSVYCKNMNMMCPLDMNGWLARIVRAEPILRIVIVVLIMLGE
jgi:hypothetical protein